MVIQLPILIKIQMEKIELKTQLIKKKLLESNTQIKRINPLFIHTLFFV